MIEIGIKEVLLALALVIVAVVIGKWRRLPVQRDMIFGTVRTFVQLLAVGYALEIIFDLQNIWLIGLAICVMILVATHATVSHSKSATSSFVPALVAIATGSLSTLALMLLLDIISIDARILIPLAGMVVSNAMNASTLTIDRLNSDIKGNRLAIETSLSLGKSWREASASYVRSASTTGMISILNFMKTVGIVALPGAMTGMILAGAEPLDAVMIQVIVAYMLLMAVTVSSVVAAEMTVRRFFTPLHQLRHDI